MAKTVHPMENANIPALLLKKSVPMFFSLLTHNLYNFVDSVFVSYVSEAALTALSMAAPVQALIGAMGCGIAVGLNAVISRAMGEKDEQKVRQTASAAIWLAIGAWLVEAFIGIVAVGPYFAWQAGGNEEIMREGIIYLRICLLCSLGTFGQWVYDRFLIATGKSSCFLFTLSVASCVNLILDPILIFGWLGLPAMGAAGAAIATVIGQFCGAAAGIVVNEKKNPEIHARFRIRVPLQSVVSILKVGIPTSLMQAAVACTGILMNTILQVFSTTAVAVMGICSRLQGLAILPIHSVTNAMIPIVAYNYGASRRDRIEQSIRWAYLYSLASMAAVVLGIELFPHQLMKIFDASDLLMEMGVAAIRIMAVSFGLQAFGNVATAVFQALGRGNEGLVLTLARQVVLPLGLAYAFSMMGRVNWVWYAFVLAEAAAVPLVMALHRRVRKHTIDRL